MKLPLWGERPTSFLIRIQRVKGGVRGQVVAVATGMSRLFGDLREAMIFIEEQVQEGRRVVFQQRRRASREAMLRITLRRFM